MALPSNLFCQNKNEKKKKKMGVLNGVLKYRKQWSFNDDVGVSDDTSPFFFCQLCVSLGKGNFLFSPADSIFLELPRLLRSKRNGKKSF